MLEKILDFFGGSNFLRLNNYKKFFAILLSIFVLSAMAYEPLVWNAENKFSGWKALRNVKCEITPQGLVLTEINADPQIVSGTLSIDPTKYNCFSFRYRAENVGKRKGQLYFAHDNGIFTASKHWQIPPLKSDGQWHVMRVTVKNLSNPSSWFECGMITRLRLDPTDSAGGKIEISDLRFCYENEKSTSSSFPSTPSKLDEPVWPKIKPEYWTGKTVVTNEPYFQGKMIKSPHDLRTGGKFHTFLLRREFELKSDPIQGWLQYTADDGAEAFVNGVEVSRSYNWRIPAMEEISKRLKAGKNVLAFRYHNARSAGGVMAELLVQYADGTFERFDTDSGFKTSMKENTGWNNIGFDESGWVAAEEQFGPPTPPWSRKILYRNLSRPQKFLRSSTSSIICNAGETVRLSFCFKGKVPDIPFNARLSFRTEGLILKDEETKTITEQQIKLLDEGCWQLDVDCVLPLYLSSGDMSIRIESGALFSKSGGFPEAKITYHGVKVAPGYEKPVSSSIVRTAYGPTFQINGNPSFFTWAQVGGNRPTRRFGDAPIDVIIVNCDVSEWWPTDGKFNFTHFDLVAEAYRRQHKDAWFMWNLSIYPPKDWAQKYPNEICRNSKGEVNHYWKTNYSFASKQALSDIENVLIKAITYLESSPYANRIIGYRVNGGHTHEWLGWDAPRGEILDFSPAAQRGFKEFAKKHYPNLKDFSVPSLEARQKLDNGEILWSPENHLNVIAFHDFYSNASADMLISLCRKAKEVLNHRKVVGTYYGYTFTLHGPGNSQMRAHYALKKVLGSGAVDFLMSPHAYSIRNIGDTCGDMKPFRSMSNHNIIPVIEDDSRTHNGPYLEYSGAFQTLTESVTIGVVRRNMGIALCRNQPVYYFYALCSGTEFDFPAMARDISTIRKVGTYCVKKQVQRNAEIALVVSEETIKSMPMLQRSSATGMMQTYQRDGSVKEMRTGSVAPTGESFIGQATRYARLGAPTDFLLAEDLYENLGNYKLYIFINCFKYDEIFLNAIEKLRQRNCVLFWIYAPGYTFNGVNNVENMKQLTGIELEKVDSPIVPAVKLSDGRWMGTQTMQIAPMFHVPNAIGMEVLGTYENGKNGIVAGKTGKAISVFSGAYQFDVPFLSALAKRAGVHIYSETSDPIEANSALFTLHARFPGSKTIHLPRKTHIVDVMNKKIVARDSAEFTFDAPLHSSWLFYYGDDADELLEKLKE